MENLNAITNESFIEYLGLRGDESVCDFGCGLGYLDAQIAERFPGVCLNGIERCEEYFAIASRRTARHGGIRIVLGDVMSSGLPDEVFDVTFCRYLLEHVTSPQLAAREMVRVTKGGGRIIVQENDLHNVLYHPEIGGIKGSCRRSVTSRSAWGVTHSSAGSCSASSISARSVRSTFIWLPRSTHAPARPLHGLD